MFVRVEVGLKPELDPVGRGFLRRVELAQPELRAQLGKAWGIEVYWIEIPDSVSAKGTLEKALREVFLDPILQVWDAGKLDAFQMDGGQTLFGLERRFRPGVTDNLAKVAHEALEIVLGKPCPQIRVASGSLMILTLKAGVKLNPGVIERLGKDHFANELIESWEHYPRAEWVGETAGQRFEESRIKAALPEFDRSARSRVESIPLIGKSDEELEALSRRHLWALSREELRAIQAYAAREGRELTDVEIEVIAQTWSEHCKHKIFNATIHYSEDELAPARSGWGAEAAPKLPALVESVFKTTIRGTTECLPYPWLLSVFSDNAGIVAFDEADALCLKVETHNSPSALDPYGGALTGIVGVNRDILGTGRGARPLFNTDVFCVAPLELPLKGETLPDRLLAPRRILEGIRRGVEHGGNKSGIPTVNGALVFDPRYLGKPLVYCGTGGILPREVLGQPTAIKTIVPGDRIIMVGGRIGKDGIHGATFSSLALDERSPVSAVQLGDPLTQKRVTDFLLQARDEGLYRTVTDNGAGGLSSSVGELASLSGGARMDVSRAKTKYPGLLPYELVISESQERMTLAVPPEKLSELQILAQRRNVEISDLGEFTESGKFEILFEGNPIASLDLEFLHSGNPVLELKGHWSGSKKVSAPTRTPRTLIEGLETLLSRPNIASKEWMIRQYDHEVQGGTIVKPLAQRGSGEGECSPNDAAVIRPKPESARGAVVSCGLCPRLSDDDPYLMAQAAVDEAVRNALSVGAVLPSEENVLALVDNFCWPDPLSEPEYAAALVRACFGLRDAALALKTPLISGKDSMKNDYIGKQGAMPIKISVPPTLLVTAMGVIPDVALSRSAEFKSAGDWVGVLSAAPPSLRGSEYEQAFSEKGETFGEQLALPNWERALGLYRLLSDEVLERHAGKLKHPLFESVHDVSEGGLWVAIAESLFARGLGIQMAELPGELGQQLLEGFGEGFHRFVISVKPENVEHVQARALTYGVSLAWVGHLQAEPEMILGGKSVATETLYRAWERKGYWE